MSATPAIKPKPARRAAESLRRSWEWKCSSGSRSLSAMQRKVPAEKARRRGRPGARRDRQEAAGPQAEQKDARRDHEREGQVDCVSVPPAGPRFEHQGGDGQGVGRLVDEGRHEDAQAGTHQAPPDLEVGRHGAGHRDPAGQRMHGQADGGGAPSHRTGDARRAPRDASRRGDGRHHGRDTRPPADLPEGRRSRSPGATRGDGTRRIARGRTGPAAPVRTSRRSPAIRRARPPATCERTPRRASCRPKN